MQSARVLCDRAVPGHRQRQEQGVQPRVVEPFADQSSGREQSPRLVFGDGRETGDDGGRFVLPHAAAKNNQMLDAGRQPLGQEIEMLVAFGQYQRRATFVNGLEHVVADELIAGFIRDQFRVQFLKLDSHILGEGSQTGETPWDGHARRA